MLQIEVLGWPKFVVMMESMNQQAFEPRDPDYERKVRASFGKQSIMQLLADSLTRVEPGLVEIELPFRQDLTQQHDYVHAGVSTTIGDSAGGYAAFSLMAPGTSVLTVEYKVNLLAPADGELFVAQGRVLRAGRRLTICEFDVHAVTGSKRVKCLHGTQTIMCMEDRADGPGAKAK